MEKHKNKRPLRDRLETLFSVNTAAGNVSRIRLSGNAAFSRLSLALSEKLASTTARTYGFALMAFGMLTVLLCFVANPFTSFADADRMTVILGLLFCIFAIPMLVFDVPMYRLVQENTFMNFLFFDFFCLPIRQKVQESRGIHPLFLVFVSVVFAVFGSFTDPMYSTLAIIGFLLFVGSFAAPEFPFFLTLLLFPYIPLLPHASATLAVLILLATVSYVRKAVVGNRFFAFSIYAVPLVLFDVLYIVSGIIHGDILSTGSGLILAVFSLGFPLASNLITNRRLADAALGSVAISSLPIAVYAVLQAVFGVENGNWVDPSFADKLTDRVYATFGNPNIYAVFLLVALLFSLALAVEKKQRAKKVLYTVIFLFNLTALILTWSRGAWIAAMIGLLICLILQIKRHGGLFVSLLLFASYAVCLIPESVINRLLSVFNTSDSTITYRFSIWRSSADILKEHPWLGIGVGADNFSSVFETYAEKGISAIHSHSLLLQIACEAGVMALCMFALLFLLRAVHVALFSRHIKASSVFYPALFSTAALVSLLVFGATDYPFTNPMMLYLFFAVLGLGSATMRIAEEEARDRTLFFTADMGAHMAAIDIDLHGF